MLALLQWRRDVTARAFAVWMAVGAAFFLGLAAGDFSTSATTIAWSGWIEITGLILLTALFVFAGTRRDESRQ